MIYVLISMGIFFVGLGFILTENNAKFILAGYNTMSQEEQAKVNISDYVVFFRKFHLYFGLSFLIFGFVLFFLELRNALGLFISFYPILGYIYFLSKSAKFTKNVNSGTNKIGIIIVLVLTLIFVAALFLYGFQESKLILNQDQIELTGIYGEKIDFKEVKSVELVEKLPVIVMKTNGFSTGDIRKGYFKTDDGVVVKILQQEAKSALILITKNNDELIYFNTKSDESKTLLDEINTVLKGQNLIDKHNSN